MGWTVEGTCIKSSGPVYALYNPCDCIYLGADDFHWISKNKMVATAVQWKLCGTNCRENNIIHRSVSFSRDHVHVNCRCIISRNYICTCIHIGPHLLNHKCALVWIVQSEIFMATRKILCDIKDAHMKWRKIQIGDLFIWYCLQSGKLEKRIRESWLLSIYKGSGFSMAFYKL